MPYGVSSTTHENKLARFVTSQKGDTEAVCRSVMSARMRVSGQQVPTALYLSSFLEVKGSQLAL